MKIFDIYEVRKDKYRREFIIDLACCISGALNFILLISGIWKGNILIDMALLVWCIERYFSLREMKRECDSHY